MSLSFYMDHHVPSAITNGLRERGINVLTAFQDNAHEMEDSRLLDRATKLGRILFTQDTDFLGEADLRQRNGIYFAGIVYSHQRLNFGTCISHLEILAKAGVPQDFENRLVYLPL